MIHVKELKPEDQATLKELKTKVQEAIVASQAPFDTFNNFADYVIRTYFNIPESEVINVQEFEISADNTYVVRFDNKPRVI